MELTMKPAGNARGQRGAMMLEALIGILIFSTGIQPQIGIQALSNAYASDAKYRADASFLANQIIAEMWVNRVAAFPAADAASPYAYAGNGTDVDDAPDLIENWVQTIVDNLPGAASYHPIITVDNVAASATYRQVSVTVRWRPPNSETTRNHLAIALISEAN
jgi:type IV pilus assembly protein PilV